MEFKLDVKDIIILKYFNDFKNTGKMNYEIINGEKYYWISYQNIENELPFLGLAKRAIMARMLRMKKFGILKHYTKKDGGTFSYYTLGERFNELLYISEKNNKDNDSNTNGNSTELKEDIFNNRYNNKINNKDEEDNSYYNIKNKESINNLSKEIKESYEPSNAFDELEDLFRSKRFKSQNIDEDIIGASTNKGIPFNEESMNIKEVDIDDNVVASDIYDEDIQHNLQKGMLFNEFKHKNAQGLAVNSDRGCASKGRTKTNILKNNNTIVTNLYNNINSKIINNNIYSDIKSIVSDVLNYLNKKVGVNYRSTNTKTINLIKLRLKEGFNLEDFKIVIDKKLEAWKGTNFEQYLNPFTLFGDKFELYLNQKVVKQDDRNNINSKNNNNFYGNYKKSRKLRFDNFTGRNYDYDKLEKQLLGWE